MSIICINMLLFLPLKDLLVLKEKSQTFYNASERASKSAMNSKPIRRGTLLTIAILLAMNSVYKIVLLLAKVYFLEGISKNPLAM